MKTTRSDIIITWVIVLLSIATYLYINDILAVILVLLIFLFRDIKEEEERWREFIYENDKLFQNSKYITLIFLILILIRVLYIFGTVENPGRNDLPGFLTIVLVISPLIAVGILAEIKLYISLKKN